MKYIRTKDELGIEREDGTCYFRTWVAYFSSSLKKDWQYADTIEELCDAFVYDFIGDDLKIYHDQCIYNKDLNQWEGAYGLFTLKPEQVKTIKGAIWTDKGLIYVAQLNDKGGLNCYD